MSTRKGVKKLVESNRGTARLWQVHSCRAHISNKTAGLTCQLWPQREGGDIGDRTWLDKQLFNGFPFNVRSEEIWMTKFENLGQIRRAKCCFIFSCHIASLMQLHFMLPCYFPENHLNTALAFSFLRQIFKSLFSDLLNVLWMLKPWCTSRHSLFAKSQPPSAVLVKQHWNNRRTQICEHQYLSKVVGKKHFQFISLKGA